MARRWKRPIAAALVVAGLMLFLAPASGASPSPAKELRAVPAAAPAATEYPVTGVVDGFSESNVTSTAVPISGDTVSAVSSACTPYFNASGSCAPLESTTTNSTGAYTLALTNGSYYLYSAPEGAYGGDSKNVTVNGTSVTAPTMDAFFELAYTNATFVLPDFNPLTGYVDDHSGTQVPVLSYTSDGVFYINASDDLVYYSFENHTARFLAPWDMLYDQIGYVGELNNYFYLTLDGSYAYELGCATTGCGGDNLLIEYAVNLTTGRNFTWNTEVPQKSTPTNAGAYLVGRGGNDSLMVLVTSNGTIRLYDPWNGTAWTGGRLAYFEANNIYWVPFLNSFINVEAAGSTFDEIEQLELQGLGSGTRFTPVFGPITNGPGGIKSNGVNGLAFNLTLNEMAYNYGSASSGSVQTVYALSDGVVSRMVSYQLEQGVPYGRFVADDHRLSVTTGAPLVNGYYEPDFSNQSWAVDPFSGQYYDTNIQEGYRVAPFEFDGAAGFDGEPAHQFLNATSAITAYSVNCANATGVAIHCPLLGTTSGTTLGTVYYVSTLPLGEFPYPATAPIAQPNAPSAPDVSPTTNSSRVTLGWSAPPFYPILNYTLFWGPGPTELVNHVNLAPGVRNFTISGLSSGQQVYYSLTATDLHYIGAATTGSVVTTAKPGPPAPTGLAAVAESPGTVNLTWTNPAVALTNDTVYYAPIATGPFTGASVGVRVSAAVGMLAEGTTYYFEVTAWNASGESPTSNEADATTLSLPSAPSKLTVTHVSLTTVGLSWANPPGSVTNDTLYYGTGPTGPFTGFSVGDVTSATATGLATGTTFYFKVSAWNSVGEGPVSNVVAAKTGTPRPPAAPTNVTAADLNQTAVRLTWTPPPGDLLNYTVAAGTASGAYSAYYNVSNGSAATTVIEGLSPSTTYYFVLWAWSNVGGGNMSQIVNATTSSLPSGGGFLSGPTVVAIGVVVVVVSSVTVLLLARRRRGSER